MTVTSANAADSEHAVIITFSEDLAEGATASIGQIQIQDQNGFHLVSFPEVTADAQVQYEIGPVWSFPATIKMVSRSGLNFASGHLLELNVPVNVDHV